MPSSLSGPRSSVVCSHAPGSKPLWGQPTVQARLGQAGPAAASPPLPRPRASARSRMATGEAGTMHSS
eukprot:8203250-Pyramimonas_sp.AAC.1